MARRLRRNLAIKTRYPITILLLVGVTSFFTWMQAGNVAHESVLKALQNKLDETITNLSDVASKTLTQKIGPDLISTPPSKGILDDSFHTPVGWEPSSTLSPVSEVEKREYYAEFFKSPAYKTSDGKPKPNNGNFIIPVLFFDVGPNNLYRLFKETIPIAKAMNRTLVVPPFHRHPRMENYVRGRKIMRGENAPGSSDKVIEVPIFDQTYMVGIETNPAKSIDVRALRYLVPVESMDRFSKACAGEKTTMLVCGELDDKRRRGVELFLSATKMKFDKTVQIDSLSDITEDKTWKVNLANANNLLKGQHCAGLAIGRSCLGSKESWLKQYKTIAPFVRRPVPVKIFAKKFISDMMGNQDYLAIHWRYDKIDWNDMCKPTRPESARKRNEQICELASKLDSEEGALLQMGKKIVRYMRQKGFRKAYLAGPPQMNATIYKLRARTPGLYTLHDVTEYAQTRRSSAGFFETNYMMSFLEQEICYLSKTFLASPLSSWSQSVLLDRMSEDRSNFESVLDVLVDGKPGLPKLTWLFPEGSWR